MTETYSVRENLNSKQQQKLKVVRRIKKVNK